MQLQTGTHKFLKSLVPLTPGKKRNSGCHASTTEFDVRKDPTLGPWKPENVPHQTGIGLVRNPPGNTHHLAKSPVSLIYSLNRDTQRPTQGQAGKSLPVLITGGPNLPEGISLNLPETRTFAH